MSLAALVDAAKSSGDFGALLAALPYARFLGLRTLPLEQGVRVHLPFQPMLLGNTNPPAFHGGVVGACLETAALLTLIRLHGGTRLPRTIDFTVDYLRPARPLDLYAEAEVQRVGRRVANVRMRAFHDPSAEPVALGRGNFLLD